MNYKLKSLDVMENGIVTILDKSIMLDNRYVTERIHRITWLEPIKESKK